MQVCGQMCGQKAVTHLALLSVKLYDMNEEKDFI